MSSSVGCSSMAKYGTTVGEALLGDTLIGTRCYDLEAVETLASLVLYRIHHVEADPIRVFVKQEPHKMSKLLTERYRLISAVSLTDTMCDRVMLGWLMKAALSSVGLTPIMIGWSPVGPGCRLVSRLFEGKDTRGLDKTAWDWTMKPWLFHAIYDLILSLAVGAPSWWVDWFEKRWASLFRDAVFQFADGSQVQQTEWAVMKSGCYLTILLNSVGQLFYHVMAMDAIGKSLDSLKYIVIGDDVTIEDFPEFSEYEDFILQHGALLKPSEPVKIPEFAGFSFPKWKGIDVYRPEYLDKHVWKITHTSLEQLEEVLKSYQLLYAYDDVVLDWIRSVMRKISPASVISKPALRYRIMVQ